MNELHLFAGAGGGILGGQLLGHTTVCAVEIESYPRKVLLQRQRDGILPKFPIWDDVCTFDGKPWRGAVDIVCGGFPCQDISSAGKGAGITGARSGLWKEYARIIGEIRPRFVFAENSPLLRTRGLGVVLEDLAALGYDARWGVLGAGAVGAPHKRDRMWVLAYRHNERSFRGDQQHLPELLAEDGGQMQGAGYKQTVPAQSCCKRSSKMADANSGSVRDVCKDKRKTCNKIHSLDNTGCHKRGYNKLRYRKTQDLADANVSRDRTSRCEVDKNREKTIERREEQSQLELSRSSEDMADANSAQRKGTGFPDGSDKKYSDLMSSSAWWGQDPAEAPESIVGRMAHGVADRVDRLKAIGNGQVPTCAAVAWDILTEGLRK